MFQRFVETLVSIKYFVPNAGCRRDAKSSTFTGKIDVRAISKFFSRHLSKGGPSIIFFSSTQNRGLAGSKYPKCKAAVNQTSRKESKRERVVIVASARS